MAAQVESCKVFLSYKWKDTGNTFTSCLYDYLHEKGIDVFQDKESLRRGEKMLPQFIRTIQRSKISIPIISKGYLESQWCLKELTEMVECYESKGQKILPIFFNVRLIDVKPSFNKPKGNDEERKWKKALDVVKEMPGHKLQDDGVHITEIKSIVKWVLTESSCFHAVKNPVMLFDGVKNIEELFCSDGEAFVGIYGERGVGKTTIAKALYERYSREFDKKCFIENIGKEASKGLENLQKQLIDSISKKKLVVPILDVAKGKELIQERFGGERVLLILDGVDSEDQFNACAIELNRLDFRSKIIITSTKKSILESYATKIHELNILDDDSALELFSWHAFSEKQPPKDYRMVCKDVLKLAEGLPSNLVELAAFLTNGNEKDKQVWQARLRGLQKITGSDLHQRIDKWYDDIKQCKSSKK